MSYNSLFDIIGPIMVGPSSSHTAGAVRIGQIARSLYGGTAAHAEIIFYGSFAHTYRGHGTDLAVVAGLLGLSTFDGRIREAFDLAKKEGLTLSISASDDTVPDPNTARIILTGERETVNMVGVSIGGGSVELREYNGFHMRVAGDKRSLLLIHRDRAGAIAEITTAMAMQQLNISRMELARKQRGEQAILSLESDQVISPELIKEFERLPGMQKVIYIR